MGEASFKPPWLLRSGHVQTALASLALRRRDVAKRATRLRAESSETILHCGAGVRLHGLIARQQHKAAAPLAVLLHGWEGSSESLYLLSCAALLYDAGFDVFRLHLRDHGPSHHLNEGVFHSCRIDEAVDAVRRIQSDYGRGPLCLAGFSLGGNFVARIARRAPGAGIDVTTAVGICPVLDPRQTLGALETGWPVYRFYFLRKWQRSLHLKAHYFPELYRPAEFGAIRSLMTLTDYFVREHSDFPDLDSYFRGYALTGDALAALQVPTRLLLAEDDPIIPIGDIEHVARPASLTVECTRHGGHCGYLTGLTGPSWADRETLRCFRAGAGYGFR